jgi:hypothetical protein
MNSKDGLKYWVFVVLMALDLLRANWTPGAKYLILEQFK